MDVLQVCKVNVTGKRIFSPNYGSICQNFFMRTPEPVPLDVKLTFINQTIFLNSRVNKNGLPEWALIEIQGDLDARQDSMKDSQFIGDLCYNKYGQPVLIIGHHILQGRENKLEKPFALLEKCGPQHPDPNATLSTTLNKSRHNKSVLESTILMQNKSKQRTGYKVKAVILKKIIFRSRPKPIIEK